jgi:hypothetical protein
MTNSRVSTDNLVRGTAVVGIQVREVEVQKHIRLPDIRPGQADRCIPGFEMADPGPAAGPGIVVAGPETAVAALAGDTAVPMAPDGP